MRCCCCCCCDRRRAQRRSGRRESSSSSERRGDSESSAVSEDDDFWETYEHREFDSFAFPPGVLCPNIICCSVPASENDVEIDIEATHNTPSFPRRSRPDQKNCWDTADGVGIKVRGPQYLQDRKKCESQSPMLVLDGAQLLRGRELESYSNSSKCCFRGNGFSLILNFRLPDVQLVISWSVAEDADWLDTPQGLHLRRFVYEMDPADRSKRLKLIARVLEGSFMLKQAVGSKPAIIGNQCSIQYFQHQDALEASMDMGPDSSIGRRLRGLLDGTSVLELFILLEGLSASELPERLLGGLTLCRADVNSISS